jgi:hypothetical protein
MEMLSGSRSNMLYTQYVKERLLKVILRWNSWTLTKYFSLLLLAIHSLSTGGFFKKTRLYFGFTKILHKKSANKKTQIFS